MEMEQGLQLRQVYAEALPILLSAGSICLMLWSQRIFRVLAEYVTIEDESSGKSQLLSTKVYTWIFFAVQEHLSKKHKDMKPVTTIQNKKNSSIDVEMKKKLCYFLQLLSL